MDLSPPTFVADLDLGPPGRNARGALALAWFTGPEVRLPAGTLSPEETAFADSLVYPKRREGWLTGRWAAKAALCRRAGVTEGSRFTILPGALDQPVVTGPEPGHHVTLSHCGALAAAAAFPETHPMGVDVEAVGPRLTETLQDQFDPREVRLCRSSGMSQDEAYTVLWTAKESVAKALRTGLTTPLGLFAVGEIQALPGRTVSRFPNFGQYRVVSIVAGGWALSVCLPDFEAGEADWGRIRDWLAGKP